MTKNQLFKKIKEQREKGTHAVTKEMIALAHMWITDGVTNKELLEKLELGTVATIYSIVARSLKEEHKKMV